MTQQNEPNISHLAPVQAIVETMYKSGLVNEFFETLINDFSIPSKMRRQVWTLCSTEWADRDRCIHVFTNHFELSTDELSLVDMWQTVIDDAWPRLPAMPLKAEIDKMPDNDWRPE